MNNRQAQCPECGGEGYTHWNRLCEPTRECSKCKGTGVMAAQPPAESEPRAGKESEAAETDAAARRSLSGPDELRKYIERKISEARSGEPIARSRHLLMTADAFRFCGNVLENCLEEFDREQGEAPKGNEKLSDAGEETP